MIIDTPIDLVRISELPALPSASLLDSASVGPWTVQGATYKVSIPQLFASPDAGDFETQVNVNMPAATDADAQAFTVRTSPTALADAPFVVRADGKISLNGGEFGMTGQNSGAFLSIGNTSTDGGYITLDCPLNDRTGIQFYENGSEKVSMYHKGSGDTFNIETAAGDGLTMNAQGGLVIDPSTSAALVLDRSSNSLYNNLEIKANGSEDDRYYIRFANISDTVIGGFRHDDVLEWKQSALLGNTDLFGSDVYIAFNEGLTANETARLQWENSSSSLVYSGPSAHRFDDGHIQITSTENSTGSGSGSIRTAGGAYIAQDLWIDGNFTVNGTFSHQNVDTFHVSDPLVKYANGNIADAVDVGWYAQYNDGTTRYNGVFRDVTDQRFKVFDNLEVEPTTTVDTGDASFRYASIDCGGVAVLAQTTPDTSVSGSYFFTNASGHTVIQNRGGLTAFYDDNTLALLINGSGSIQYVPATFNSTATFQGLATFNGGITAPSTGTDSEAFGSGALAGNNSVSVGKGAVSLVDGVAVGKGAINSFVGDGGVVIGEGATNSAGNGIAIGNGASCGHLNSISFGTDATTSNNQVKFGNQSKILFGNASSNITWSNGLIVSGITNTTGLLTVNGGITAPSTGTSSEAYGLNSSAGDSAIAVGDSSVADSFSVSLGSSSGNTTGQSSCSSYVAVGFDSRVTTNGISRSIGIGNNIAIAHSNSISIGVDADTIASNALRFGSASYPITRVTFGAGTEEVTIDNPLGSTTFSGTVTIGAFTIPNTDGTANQVLKTDGAGVLTWQDDNVLTYPLTAPDGTFSAPSYSFATSTDTGNYLVSAGVLGFSAGGVLATSMRSTVVTIPLLTGSAGIGEGAFVVYGGASVAENIYAGGIVDATTFNAETTSTSYTSDEEADYTNLQANISWTQGGLFNDLALGTNFALASAGSSALDSNWRGSIFAAFQIDGTINQGTNFEFVNTADYGDASSNYYQCDFGTSRTINLIRIWNSYTLARRATQIRVYVSNDAFSSNVTDLGVFDVSAVVGTYINYDIIIGDQTCNSFRISIVADDGVDYGYTRFTSTEIEAYDATAATTGNTADTEIYSGAAASFAPSTLVVKDPMGGTLADGDVTIDYAINGGAFTGSQLSLNAFKALAEFSGVTQLELRVQPVVFVGITEVSISTPSSVVNISDTGNIVIQNNAVDVFTVNASGQVYAAGDCEIVGELTIGDYTLPNTDGTSGQVLKTDGLGTLTWQDDSASSFPLLAPDGLGSAPSYSFASDTDTGMYLSNTGILGFTVSNTLVMSIRNNVVTSTKPVSISASSTVSAPTLYLEGDANTGLYRPAASELAVTVSGTQRCRFSSTGVNVTGALSATGVLSITGDSTDYGEIYVQGNSTGQTTNASAGTFDKVTQFDSNGVSRNCTNTAASDQITVANAGKYIAHLEASFSGTLSAEIKLRFAINGTTVAKSESARKLGTGGDVGSASCHCILDLSASDVVTVYVASDGSSDSFVLVDSNLTLIRV